MTNISPEAVKAWINSHKHLVGFTNVFTDAEARHMFDMLTELSAERDILVQECDLLEIEKNMLEDDVEPLNQELSERHKILMQLQAERDALKASVARLLEVLESIAKNTCCDRCQEAALVARAAIAAAKETLL